MSESHSVPGPLEEALSYLGAKRQVEVRVDAISDNFAYVWVADLQKSDSTQAPGGWIRLPTAFPFGNPHGLVTIEPLKRRDGALVTDAHNPGHDVCKPVRDLGGAHYYSWTWKDCPAIQDPKDILGVVQWYERNIRNG